MSRAGRSDYFTVSLYSSNLVSATVLQLNSDRRALPNAPDNSGIFNNAARSPSQVSDVNQLLFVEAVLKGVAGLLLVLVPGLTIKLLGLQRSDSTFWPRVAGALLLGLSAASVLEGSLLAKGGLGLAGSIAVNLSGIAIIGAMLIMGHGAPRRRGRLILWCLVIALSALSLVELAFAI